MRIDRGFTLIELMITVVIVAILATIAIPSYTNYVIKSHVRSAMSDVVSLSLVLENLYQRNLQYPASTSTDEAVATYISDNKGIAWTPTESNNFAYTVAVTATTYTLTAKGIAGKQNEGCTITLTNDNKRNVAPDNVANACGGLLGGW